MNLETGTATDASVLVVDDEPANVALVESILDRNGFTRVRGTTDPRRSAPCSTHERPDIVLLDLHMPHVCRAGTAREIDYAGAEPDEYLPVFDPVGRRHDPGQARRPRRRRHRLPDQAVRRHRGRAARAQPPRDPPDAPAPRRAAPRPSTSGSAGADRGPRAGPPRLAAPPAARQRVPRRRNRRPHRPGGRRRLACCWPTAGGNPTTGPTHRARPRPSTTWARSVSPTPSCSSRAG